MGRTLAELMRDLPPDRRAKVEARTGELLAEVENLRALRQLAERSQGQIASALGVKQPSVHKIERQADLYLSTLRRFVEAAGGTLELRVELPGKGQLRLMGIGDLRADARGREPIRPGGVAEERSDYVVDVTGSGPGAGPAQKKPRRRGRRTGWTVPKVRRMEAGESEAEPGQAQSALAAS